MTVLPSRRDGTAGGAAGVDPGGLDPVRAARTLSRTVVGLVLVVAVVDRDLLAGHGTWFLVAGFLLGLPHGAVDHVLPFRHGWLHARWAALAGFLLAYVAAAVLAFVGVVVAGDVVLPLLLVASVLHFGAGDLSATRGATTAAASLLSHPGHDSRGTRLAGWLWDTTARGGPVLAGPFLVWPGTVADLFGTLGWHAHPSPSALVVVGASLLVVCGAGAVRAWRHQRRGEAADVVALLALFLLVPPLPAFGVYFGAWHGLRHTARLVADDPADAATLRAGRWGPPLLHFVRTAAVPSAAALLTVVGLAWTASDHPGLAAPVFALLLALTVPHLTLVAWWDWHDTGSVSPG